MALRLLGRDVTFYRFPGENHELSRTRLAGAPQAARRDHPRLLRRTTRAGYCVTFTGSRRRRTRGRERSHRVGHALRSAVAGLALVVAWLVTFTVPVSVAAPDDGPADPPSARHLDRLANTVTVEILNASATDTEVSASWPSQRPAERSSTPRRVG